MARKLQFVAYDGDLIDVMPDGQYLAVDVTDRVRITSNSDLSDVWGRLNTLAQTVSAHPTSLQSVLTRELVDDTLRAINQAFALVHSKTTTLAGPMFHDTYGGPPQVTFEQYPIRWPGENPVALRIVQRFVSALFQIPHVPSNRLDAGIRDIDAGIILRPLLQLKAEIMRQYFGLETKGDISPDELDAIFRDSNLMPPLNVSRDDNADTQSDLAAEDSRALGDTSAQVPTVETREMAMNGIEVWTWVPTESHWITFAEIQRRLAVSGPTQPPAAPFPLPTDGVINSSNVDSRGRVGGNNPSLTNA